MEQMAIIKNLERIEYVLNQSDQEKYYLHWSG